MSFQICNVKTDRIVDIVENRQLNYLLRYFSYFTHKVRSNVKIITIDMYSPYVTLIQRMFPNAKITIDKFHLVQLISRLLNKIKAMKKADKNYNKLKRYWKLILKSRDKLNNSKWKRFICFRFICFKDMMTELDVDDYLIETNKELNDTYQRYQDLLYSFKHNSYNRLINSIKSNYKYVSSYMKTSIKTIKQYLPYIKNIFEINIIMDL